MTLKNYPEIHAQTLVKGRTPFAKTNITASNYNSVIVFFARFFNLNRRVTLTSLSYFTCAFFRSATITIMLSGLIYFFATLRISSAVTALISEAYLSG